MEGKNKKDMSVDELVRQLKLVLDIDETEDEPDKGADKPEEPVEKASEKSVGNDDGKDVGEELDRLFEEEETKKSKPKKRGWLFGRRKKEEPEDGGDEIEDLADNKPTVTTEETGNKPEEPVNKPEEQAPPEETAPESTAKEDPDGWFADALSGLVFDDGEEKSDGKTEEPEEEQTGTEAKTEPSADAEYEAPEVPEESEEPEEPEATEEPEISEADQKEPDEYAEESSAEPVENTDELYLSIPDDSDCYPDEIYAVDVSEEVKTYGTESTGKTDADPFVSDVFGEKTDEDEEATKTVGFAGTAPDEEEGGQTREVKLPGQTGEPADEIDDGLIADIENFDVIFSDKKEEDDGYTTADEAIMDAFAEKPKPKKNKRKTEAEEVDDIFSEIPAAPVGGKSAADYEDDYDEIYPDEFTSYDQRKTFLEEYKKKYRSFKRSLIGSSVFAVLLLIYELLPLFIKELPHSFSRTENPSVFTLVGLVLFTLCAAFASTHTFAGFRSVFKGNTTLPSMAFLSVLFTYIYGIIIAVKGEVMLYPMMSVAAFSVVAMLAAEMRIIKRRTYAFRIISGSPVKNKFVLERYQSDGEKQQGTSLGVSRAKFISKFTASNIKKSNAYGYLNIMFPATALVFILFFAVGLFLKKDVSYAVSYGFAAGIFCMPIAVFSALSMPTFLCSKKAYGDGSCIVSDADAEKYTAANTVFFEDTEVFPPSHDKITSVRLYNDSRMDHIMYIMMSIFGKLGGPLLVICENAAKEYGSSSDVKIIKTGENGVEAKVDSFTVRIGSADYMGTAVDRIYREDDGMYENSETERIMYMTVNGVVTAKFYIEYGMDPEFKRIIKQLSNATRTVAIRTLDPNIDSALLSAFIDPEIYNCKIVSGRTRKNDVREESCGTIVSKSSVKSLMRALLLCDKTVYTSKINALICFLSLIIGLLITVFLMITGSLNVINVLYAAAYHLIITLIVRIVTRLHI